LNTETLALLRLQAAAGIGQRTITKMRQWCATTNSPTQAIFELSDKDALALFGLKSAALDGLATARTETAISAARSQLEQLNALHCRIILRGEPQYPATLEAHLQDDAPPVLYMIGSQTLFSQHGIAFSGARNVSSKGIEYTDELARQTVEQGLTVISGHAPGVDNAAHTAALEHKGSTLLVIPEGMLKFRLRAELKVLQDNTPQRLGVISEFPPALPWSSQNAMIRNRTILGLSRAAVVVEAGENGGTWDAGMRALDMKLPLYVLSYTDPPPSAAGNRALIARGGIPIPELPAPVLPIINTTAQDDDPPNEPKQLTLF